MPELLHLCHLCLSRFPGNPESFVGRAYTSQLQTICNKLQFSGIKEWQSLISKLHDGAMKCNPAGNWSGQDLEILTIGMTHLERSKDGCQAI